MESGQILMYVLQTLITIALGLVGWSVKNSIAELKNGIKHNADDIKRLEERHSSELERMKEKFDDLKSDLPFVYVTREDYVRTMNNVDKQMSDINGKLDRLLSGSKEG